MRLFKCNRQHLGEIVLFLVLIILFSVLLTTINIRREIPFINGSAVAFGADEKQPDGDKNREEGKEQTDGEVEEKPCPECPDPAKVILKGLEEKKQQIAKEQEQLKQERKELEKFKEEIDESLEKLTALKKQIQADLDRMGKKKSDEQSKKDKAFEDKMNRLVKVYSGMKPKKAAEIFNQMDYEVAREIFSRMRESSASEILAFVDSEKAAKISERLAHKKK